MFRKVFLNRRRAILVFACLIIWWTSVDLYMQSQEPLADHLTDSTWCWFPLTPFLKMAFKEDGTFFRRIVIADNPHFASVNNDSGSWFVDEEGSKTWIRIIGTEDMLVKAHTYRYMRLEGDFPGLGNRMNVNLYRCNDTLPLR
jgi:hypothetical protein